MSLSTVSASPSLAQAFAAAAEVVGRVLDGESLNTGLGDLKYRASSQALAAAGQDLCYNALRGYGLVDVALGRLLERPLADSVLRGLLLAAFAELAARPQAAHAVVHQAVEAAVLLGHSRAKGLVNAVLRNFQRRMHQLLPEIEATEVGRYRHPQWWIDALRAAYPREWEAALLESNRHPPMVLRVNRRRLPASAYLEKLERTGIPARALGQEAVLLERPCRVERLPGFAAGEVSVQDAGAQRAAPLLDVRDGMRVLDACAAPGGKTGHLLELARCELLAVDSDGVRAQRIGENLSRLGLAAKIVVGDCSEPESFSAGRTFDRILLDAPCSASGVVRRHPDIRWLRRRADTAEFARAQAELLDALWPVLATDGKLLYATCSVFPEENGGQVRAFLTRHPEAELLPLPGLDGGQILPSAYSDGFFYALLTKGQPPR
ncbi:MAG: 16S rRNA (cytosine(967)-C(5))-methyltransferase RsmB [Betaproteobacteria bacterium]|nr:MAG: 16S rRNA (cytosine(967)-C(5))-methyltransferase RsmB [Betaproteobacteria bacterium]